MPFASAGVAGRRMNSANETRRDEYGKRCNKPVNQERIEKGSGAIGDPSEGEASEDRGKRFDLRLAEMRQREGNGLQPEGVGPEFAGIGEEDEATTKKFPAEEIQKCIPGQSGQLRPV